MVKSVRDEFNERLRDGFIPALKEAFAAKFDGKQINTAWNIFHSCYVSTPELTPNDEDNVYAFDFTSDMQAFISGYETAWLDASAIVQAFK
jgi:hypothetical protein